MRTFEDHCWKDMVTPDILEIYKHYERETFIGKRPAVLLIDLYNLVYEGGGRPVTEVVKDYPSSCGIHAWQAVEPTQQLIALARTKGIPLIYSTQGTNQIQATYRQKNVIFDHSYEIKEEFSPQKEDVILYKERASCFFGTPLIAYLTQMGIDSLIICGESTSGCVRATTVDAYSYGFHAVVVEECTFDRSWLSHQVSLFDLHHKYADVMHLDEVKEHLSHRPNL
ncbi:isochorismatase family protein [Ammoniphilus sp. YIM 78166]|uniref:isochorismatase family protein n=1 Tax=Ammoniphilus sp. YIM 78166 TaxID=1644106 RepID=UPI001070570B|nr:isochorismatase family protein [Ammoniphilus sp. YIM 78166]